MAGTLSIHVKLGSDLAEGAHSMVDMSDHHREVVFDELADCLKEELELAYPSAKVRVTCKPGVDTLREGLETDIIVTSSDPDLFAEGVNEVVQEYVDSVSTDFFDDEDALLELVGDDLEEAYLNRGRI